MRDPLRDAPLGRDHGLRPGDEGVPGAGRRGSSLRPVAKAESRARHRTGRRRKPAQVAADFVELAELAELDSVLPSQRRQSMGMALAMRPWALPPVTGLEARERSTARRRPRA